MIYHIIQGNILHLSPGVVKGILLNAPRISKATKMKHFFYINMFCEKMLYNNVEINPYTKLFSELGTNQYKLVNNQFSLFCLFFRLKQEDSVIFHSNPPALVFLLINLLLLLFRRNLLSRVSYVCWGNDFDFTGTRLRNKIYYKIIRNAFEKYHSIITICNPDLTKAKSLYPNANVQFAEYVAYEKRILLSKIKESNHKLTVVVSHSGWPHNNHLHSFDLLRGFAGKIKVVCPLCYGNKDYIEKIVTEGKRIFSDDFSYFTDLKEKMEYRDWLRTTDIYISSAMNQTGLGAINFSLWSGSKVYLTGDLLDFYKSQDYNVFDLETIKNLDFDVFSKPISEKEAQRNIDIFNKTMYDAPKSIEVWKSVFEMNL